jgi:hypothetical protein
MKMESLQQRREELERKECDLKEQLLKFDHFLKVCRMFFLKHSNGYPPLPKVIGTVVGS